MRKQIVVILSLILSVGSIVACPFTIKNDGTTDLLVIDPYHGYSVRIVPKKEKIINPTLSGVIGYIRHEALDFYVESSKRQDTFYRHYRLVEKYCTKKKGENNISLSSLANLAQNPTDRLSVKSYKHKRRLKPKKVGVQSYKREKVNPPSLKLRRTRNKS